MHLVELTCDGFRGLRDVTFRPSAGLNVIRGHNAQGKTSLLEAILYLTTSKSHRTSNESELVRHGADAFHITAQVTRKDRQVALEAHWWRGTKRFRINGVAQTRLSDILGKVHLVFFSPEDVGIVRGAATQRRQFLDMELSQLSPAYLHALQQFRQVLRQRNELLRQDRPAAGLLDVWDVQLVQHGGVLMRERAEFTAALARLMQTAYSRIADTEPLELRYAPNIKDDESYETVLKRVRDSDQRRGVTTRGPHRDDLEFLIDGHAARGFGSQGQQRSAALALKLAEVELVRERAGEYPMLMLDDVLSELDVNRGRRLFGALSEGVQCLLTTTDLTEHPSLFGESTRYFTIQGGCLGEG